MYIENGEKVEVSGENLFESSWLVEVDGLGTFETYPNRDSTNYIEDYELNDVSHFYRGLLRHPGYCNSIQSMKDLNLLDDQESKDLQGVTYNQFTASLLGVNEDADVKEAVAEKLNLRVDSFDPLAEDVLETIQKIASDITNPSNAL